MVFKCSFVFKYNVREAIIISLNKIKYLPVVDGVTVGVFATRSLATCTYASRKIMKIKIS